MLMEHIDVFPSKDSRVSFAKFEEHGNVVISEDNGHDWSWLFGRVDGQARLLDFKTDRVVARFTEHSDVFTSI